MAVITKDAGISRANINLVSGEVTALSFAKSYEYYAVRNDGANDFYISTEDSACTPNGDNVVCVKASDSYVHHNGLGKEGIVYFSGNGAVTVIGQDTGENPFKTSWKGGVDGTLSKAGYAADSKVVGDKLKVLQDVINGVTHRFVTDNTTAYSKSVPVGAKIASVNRVGGRTIVWNQLQVMPTNDNVMNISQHSNVVIDSVVDGKITVTDNGDNSMGWGLVNIGGTTSGIVGHKYYCRATFTIEQTGGQNLFYVFGNIASATSNIVNADLNITSIPQTVSIIGTCNSSTDIWGFLQFKMGGGITFSAENMMCFDLTKMFGAGNEPSTVEEFEAMFPNDYYPYNEGTLMPSPITAFNSIIDGRTLQTKEMPSAVLALEGYGDGINDSVYNYIDFETKTYHKCVGAVDLGTLYWSNTEGTFFTTGIIDIKHIKNYGYTIIALCEEYTPKEYDDVSYKFVDNAFGCFYDYEVNYFKIYDSSKSELSSEAFAQAMNGVMLYYELETPIITDISDMFPSDVNILDVMPGGKLVFENENKIAVPSEVEYIVDLAEVIAND